MTRSVPLRARPRPATGALPEEPGADVPAEALGHRTTPSERASMRAEIMEFIWPLGSGIQPVLFIRWDYLH